MTTKTPRLIRRGDVVKIKGTDEDMIVRGVQIVLQLANGLSEVYDSGEMVELGIDTDLSPAELVEAAGLDAAERVVKAAAASAAIAATAAAAAAGQEAADAYVAAAATPPQKSPPESPQVPPE